MSEAGERYLQELASRLPRRGRRRILTEIRYHLEQAVAEAQSAGIDEAEAERLAMEELGSPSDVVGQFAANPRRRLRPRTRIGWVAAGASILALAVAGLVAMTAAFSGGDTAHRAAQPPVPPAAPTFGPIRVPGQAQALAAFKARYPAAHARAPVAVFTSPPPLQNGSSEWLWVIPLSDGRLCPLLQLLDDHGAVVDQTAGSNESWCVTSIAPHRPSLIGNYAIPHDQDQRVILGRAPGALDVEVRLADGTSIERPTLLKAFFLIVVNGRTRPGTTVTRITSYLGLAPPSKPGAAMTWRTLSAT